VPPVTALIIVTRSRSSASFAGPAATRDAFTVDRAMRFERRTV